MEYFVRFVDGTETMVAHTFGPMKPLIKAYEKQQAKQTRTSTKMRADGKKSAVIYQLEYLQWLLRYEKKTQFEKCLSGFPIYFIYCSHFDSEKWLNVK